MSRQTKTRRLQQRQHKYRYVDRGFILLLLTVFQLYSFLQLWNTSSLQVSIQVTQLVSFLHSTFLLKTLLQLRNIQRRLLRK